jgi:hypothetical protein
MNRIRTAGAHAVHRTHSTAQRLVIAARWSAGLRRLRTCRGQGTVEYVGIVIVIGVLLVAVKAGVGGTAASALGKKISTSVSNAIQHVMDNAPDSKG